MEEVNDLKDELEIDEKSEGAGLMSVSRLIYMADAKYEAKAWA